MSFDPVARQLGQNAVNLATAAKAAAGVDYSQLEAATTLASTARLSVQQQAGGALQSLEPSVLLGDVNNQLAEEIARAEQVEAELDAAIAAASVLAKALTTARGMFAAFSDYETDADLPAVLTAGFSATGDGGSAVYAVDALATATLAAAHPLACKADAKGRYFRLLGTPDGFVTPEMLGCPVYAAGTNQQPYIQAAINYAKAAGLKGVYFPQSQYELWATPRTGFAAGNGYDSTVHTGEFILIDQFPCMLVGRFGNRTTLNYKGPTGGSLLTDYQTVNSTAYGGDCIWRGAAIKLTGSVNWGATRPAASALSSIIVRDLIFKTDMVGVQNNAYPAYPLSRDPTGARQNCWDTTNKGIWGQQNVHIGDITLENVDILGFLGEALYATSRGDTGNQKIVGRNLVIKDSNGQALNPNGMQAMDIDGLYASNCTFAVEGWFGYDYGRLANAYFKDCSKGAQLAGGTGTAMALRSDGSMPILQMDNVVFDNCGTILVNSYVHGRFTAIDSTVSVQPVTTDGLCQFNSLEITAIRQRAATQAGTIRALRFANSTTNTSAIRNNRIRLIASRTATAVANALTFGSLVSQSGTLGSDNYVYLRGEGGGSLSLIESANTGYVPTLIDEGIDHARTPATLFDPTTTATPDWTNLRLAASTFSAGAGVYTVNLPAATQYQVGAELALDHNGGGYQSSYILVVDPTESNARRCLLKYGQIARFKLSRAGRWDLVNPVAPIAASASIDVTSTAAAAESGPYAITHAAAQPYMHARVVPASVLTGFVISAIRAEAGVVKFWVRNIDGAATLDPAAQVFTATVTV